ncbi:hypothetical protein HYV44_03595 [Candidatus Microgenomates bacterium]|nr:hypothetical protein [Candidatus Microgenomates bacterium]
MTRKKERGIALITTLIISGIMLTSIGLFTREMLDEVKNSTRIDNSLIAYYAAEAGLEEALLSWRYNKDSEISFENDTNANVDVTDKTNNSPRCVNLDKDNLQMGRLSANICTAAGAKDPKSRYYGLKMWYKTPQIQNLQVNRDDVVEIGIPSLTGDLKIEWTPNPATEILAGSERSGYRMEITVYDEEGSIIPIEKGGKFFTSTFNKSVRIQSSRTGVGKKIIRIKPWYTKSLPEPGTNIYTEGSAPKDSSIPFVNLNITRGSSSDLMTTPKTIIESTGYFGNVVRKIIVEMDRSTGQIVGMLDYAIYAESELVK